MMKVKKIPTVIFGSAGASKETYYLIKQSNNNFENDTIFQVIGFVESDDISIGQSVTDNQKIIASDATFAELINNYECIGIIIPFGDSKLKEKIVNKVKTYKNVFFPNIIHPSVILEREIVHLGIGNIIAAGTVIACDLKMSNFNLINRSCTIGHDISLGSFNTINPMSCISGNVTISDRCLLGAGSVILQGLSIEEDTIVGAGAVVTKNVKSGTTVIGVPAKEV